MRLTRPAMVVASAGMVVAVALVAAAIFRPQPAPINTAPINTAPIDTSGLTAGQDPLRTRPAVLITVHVSGAVARPGLVQVGDGARVADAVAAAGGATAGADLTAVNLADTVSDGMQLIVPAGTGESASPAIDGVTRDGKVDLNRAGVEALSQLPGVGAVLASRIVSHRESQGPFGAIEDLLDVPGIGEGKLASIREHATVR